MKVIDPATGAQLAEVQEHTPEQVAELYARARAAQPGWAGVALTERLAIVRRFRGLIIERADALAATLTSETGKPIAQARAELAGVVPRLDFFLEHTQAAIGTDRVLDDESGSEPLREEIAHEPLGVIANISAWNYPWFVGSNVFVPALLTGNAVLYKPSELAMLTGAAIAELLVESGVPVDVFGLVLGGGDLGAAVVGQPIDGVFFTGSYRTGLRIAEASASRMIAVQLELGGKDPVYVTDDVDPSTAAASLADGAFYNNGQSCCSVERIYVHERVHDAFVEAFVAVVESFVMGEPTDEATYLGPLTRPEQLAVLEHQVADALDKGAVVATGGRRVERPGSWFEPTVLTSVHHEMAVMRDETFGPLIGVQRVADDAEAIALVNDTDYGLTAGVYGREEQRARRILEQVDAGSAYWNCCDRVSPRLPWSGRGHSGIGSTLSRSGILAFTRPKAWHLRG